VRLALRTWKLFSPDLDLSDSAGSEFKSLRECFIRALRPGARPIAHDPDVVVSPCDAIVGACGRIDDDVVIQAKGLSYRLDDLLRNPAIAKRHRRGRFVTLRLRSTMYHRFHAPAACRVREVTHIAGDTWNVNPIALKRVERLYCRNERAVLPLELEIAGRQLTLVPIGAIGVASLRLHCLDATLGIEYEGPNHFVCDARYAKGQELGWFELGSTIVVLASENLELAEGIRAGREVRVGQPLLTASTARCARNRLDRTGCGFERKATHASA